MSLEQLMAFTVTTDHARQERVWDAVQRSYNEDPCQIRRMLTSAQSAPPTSGCASSGSRTTRRLASSS